MTELLSWRMTAPDRPLELTREPLPEPARDEVLLRVMACGLCHTDVGFLYGGVRPNAPLPLTLGHEIVGEVVATGADAKIPLGDVLLVPAVLPCGDCDLCRRGRGNVCRNQKMPGNDFHGGFASHFLAPARFLSRLPKEILDQAEELSVVADAVATSYQAVVRSGIEAKSMVVVVGLGGVGTFAAQAAKALGAHVAGIDIDEGRLEAAAPYLDLPLQAGATALSTKEIRGKIAAFEKERGLPRHGRKILECSGTAPGQTTAYALLNHDATLAVVGFTRDKIELRLSNVMAFDATVFGNWGCLPEHFPALLDLIRQERIVVRPYVARYPMSRLNELLKQEGHLHRPVLIPDFETC